LPIHMTEVEKQELQSRIAFWMIAAAGVFALLLIRFWVLQVVQYEVWRGIADDNQIRRVTVPAMRGNIYDRNKRLLADWDRSYNIMVVPADLNDDSITRLAGILEMDREELDNRIKENRYWSPFIPVLAAEGVSWDKFARVEENRVVMQGVYTEFRPVRKYYPDSALVSHVLGYLREITGEQLNSSSYKGYRMGDRVGRTGLEKTLERSLRGKDGVIYKLVDARGREISMEAATISPRGQLDYRSRLNDLRAMSRPVEPGDSAVLTIDIEMQKIADKHMKSHHGSVVIMDVWTGELLTLLSNPGYDPSIFEGKISKEKWDALANSPAEPFLNRAMQKFYAPGSIFKIITATAALEENVVTPSDKFLCKGIYRLKDTSFRCWNRWGHGKMAMEDSLVESCDVYYYELSQELGIDNISKWARKFGLGSKISIGIDGEETGLVPDRKWMHRTKKRIWYPGETVLVSIGQGPINITPLQAVLIPAAIATEGRIMRPQLIHHFENVHGKTLSRFQPRVLAEKLFSQPTAELMQRAMDRVVNDERGTAYKHVHSEFVKIAGKTGTAQVTSKYVGKPIEEIPYDKRDHSWFVAYAPAESPQIAVVVMVEHGGSGGATAGSITKKIIEDIFSLTSARSEAIQNSG